MLGLLRVLQVIWEWDPGKARATSRTTGILSATFSLTLALSVVTAVLLERVDYYELARKYLEVLGMDALWAPVIAGVFLVAGIATISFFFGLIIYLSTPKRSYIGHAWQGAVLVLGWIVLFVIARLIWSLVEVVGWRHA